MEGTIEVEGTEYWWWAGPANNGAKEGYCVHCRNENYGVTRYIKHEPNETDARSTARELAPMVNALV